MPIQSLDYLPNPVNFRRGFQSVSDEIHWGYGLLILHYRFLDYL